MGVGSSVDDSAAASALWKRWYVAVFCDDVHQAVAVAGMEDTEDEIGGFGCNRCGGDNGTNNDDDRTPPRSTAPAVVVALAVVATAIGTALLATGPAKARVDRDI